MFLVMILDKIAWAINEAIEWFAVVVLLLVVALLMFAMAVFCLLAFGDAPEEEDA